MMNTSKKHSISNDILPSEVASPKKGRQSDIRMTTALELRFRAKQETDKGDINNVTYWLIQGGYTEADKESMGTQEWNKLCNNFSTHWRRYRLQNPVPEENKPIWEQEYMKIFVRLEDANEKLLQVYPTIINYLEKKKKKSFKKLVKVNLEQIEITDFLQDTADETHQTTRKPKLMAIFQQYFKDIGMEKLGITTHNLICNALKNTSDEFDFQEAHQDYFPKVISGKGKKQYLAWSAIIPMTSDGSWITVWYSTETKRTFQIKLGQVLLFRSDVVHCGGRPAVDLIKGATFYRLHFYLQTEFQMAPDNEVCKLHFDGETSLTVLYRQTEEQKKKYAKIINEYKK